MRRFGIMGAAAVAAMGIVSVALAAGGFDQFGYNDRARVFNGAADGVDRSLDGKVWGDPTYANDHLVMKWNAQWDNCNDHGYDTAAYCLGAWTTNEWNGMRAGGSQENWHYKIIWVGSAGPNSPYWVEGGYSLWGNYEAIADHGVADGEHIVYAKGVPNGLGGH